MIGLDLVIGSVMASSCACVLLISHSVRMNGLEKRIKNLEDKVGDDKNEKEK